MSTQPLLDRGRIRQPGTYAAPSLTFDLDAEFRSLVLEQPWQAGHTAKTIVKYPDLRIVLVALQAGARLLQHETTGRISIHTLSGHLRVSVPERTADLPAGSILALDRDVPHEVEAAVDSAFLLTIAWPGVHQPAVPLQPVTYLHSRIAESLGSDVPPLSPPRRPSVIPINESRKLRESGLDKTLADTFPCSDAFSSIPDPVLKGW